MFQKIVEEYRQLAPHYDRLWSSYIDCSTQETLQRLPLTASTRARLLDVGCGSGALLRAVQEQYPLVEAAGVDPSVAMLEVARDRLSPRTQLVAGRAEHLPFAAGQFDVVVSCSAFHYFEHPRQALGELSRVLQPTGCLVVTDWCDDFLACKVCGLILKAMQRPIGRLFGMRDCVRLLSDVGFRGIDADRYRINLLWGMMTVRAVA